MDSIIPYMKQPTRVLNTHLAMAFCAQLPIPELKKPRQRWPHGQSQPRSCQACSRCSSSCSLLRIEAQAIPRGGQGRESILRKFPLDQTFFATAVNDTATRFIHQFWKKLIKGNFPESGVSRKSLGGVQQHDKGRKSWHQKKKQRLENTRVDHRFFCKPEATTSTCLRCPKK